MKIFIPFFVCKKIYILFLYTLNVNKYVRRSMVIFIKELNRLKKYVEHYKYDYELESLQINNNDAYIQYKKVITEYNMKKWHLDIALDCIRELSTDSRKYLMKYPDATMYHLGLGLYIRNNYIYHAKKHSYLMGDYESNCIIEIIISILHPVYSFENKKIKAYYYWSTRIKKEIIDKMNFLRV